MDIHTENNKHTTCFQQSILCRIVNVHWPDKIINNDLWAKIDQEPVVKWIKRRKWSWLGDTLRSNVNSIAKQALQWTPQGQNKRATTEYLEKRSGVRSEDRRIQVELEEDGGGSCRHSWMENSGLWPPMLHWERQGIGQVKCVFCNRDVNDLCRIIIKCCDLTLCHKDAVLD